VNLLDHLWPDAGWNAPRVDLAARVLEGLGTGHFEGEHADFTLCLAAMLHDRSPAEVRRVGEALRCSNDQINDACWLAAHTGDIDRSDTLSLPAFKKLMAHPRFSDLLNLHEVICRVRSMPLDANAHARRRAADIPAAQVAPPPFITGDDLIAAGLTPGPAFKTILDTLYDEQLDNLLRTREQALAKMLQMIQDGQYP
jgi:poly(A) polymerase